MPSVCSCCCLLRVYLRVCGEDSRFHRHHPRTPSQTPPSLPPMPALLPRSPSPSLPRVVFSLPPIPRFYAVRDDSPGVLPSYVPVFSATLNPSPLLGAATNLALCSPAPSAVSATWPTVRRPQPSPNLTAVFLRVKVTAAPSAGAIHRGTPFASLPPHVPSRASAPPCHVLLCASSVSLW
jgi:hypothetical protein